MKCDELKQYEVFVTNPYNTGGSFREIAVLPSDKVDEAIAELKAENERLKKELKHSEDELESYFIFEKEIKQKLRATRRALYKACANWARSERYTEATWHGDEEREELWAEVQDKCLKKAEEYK